VPECLKAAIGVGIGLFIAFIGLKNGGVIVANESNFVALGNLKSAGVILFLLGFLICAFLFAKQIKGGLLIGILITTVIGMFMGITSIPAGPGDLFNIVPPIPAETFGKLDIKGILGYGLFSVIFSITLVDMFDNIGTLIGVSKKAKLVNKDGKIENLDKALISDSIAAVAGALLGTSTVTTYIESATGVAEGGRTGLTAVTTGILYLLTLFFAPLFLLIPTQATAPVLVIVGILMLGEVVSIDFTDFTEAFPSFLTILLMPLTFSIAQGLSFGFIGYAFIKLVTGKGRSVHPVMYILAICFIIHFLV
jgi:AGZA family xanthine/uracil permease-like MFS transporter